MRLRTILTLFVFATTAAPPLDAFGQGSVRQEALHDRLRRVDEFVWDGPLFMKGRRTLQQVRNLSRLLGEKVQKSPNPHVGGQIDEFRTLTFEGLELYGRVTPAQEFSPITAVITTPRWRIRNGLDVGSSAARVASVLGQPMQTTGAILEYQGESERVNFHVGNGIIKKIEFFYYAD